MNAILTPDDGEANEGTEIRAWHDAPVSWIHEVAVDARFSERAWAELDRRGLGDAA